jgi:allophanate hydrolase subunit 2
VPRVGVRTYLAVRGGIDVPPVFGSRATDLLGGIGPPPLTAGTRLPIGTATTGFPDVDLAPVAPPGTALRLPVVPGPRADWFAADALSTLTAAAYEVTPDSNRVALRLAGPPLRPTNPAELPTEGMATGSLQIPADGQPLLFLADHPVTGGYPVLAVLTTPALDHAAQARPGTPVRFTLTT